MRVASRAFEEWRKLSAEVRQSVGASEDFLTARTFGLLRYLPAQAFHRVMAELGVALPQGSPGTTHEVELWPLLDLTTPGLDDVGLARCEPDAWIRGDGYSLVVEAKFVGSRLGDYLSQLGREWLLGRELSPSGSSPWLLLITPDARAPRVQGIATSEARLCASGDLVSIERQICEFIAWARARTGAPIELPEELGVCETVRWISWTDLARACDRVRASLLPSEGPAARLLKEVREILHVFGFDPFDGWSIALEPVPRIECFPPLWNACAPSVWSQPALHFNGLPTLPESVARGNLNWSPSASNLPSPLWALPEGPSSRPGGWASPTWS